MEPATNGAYVDTGNIFSILSDTKFLCSNPCHKKSREALDTLVSSKENYTYIRQFNLYKVAALLLDRYNAAKKIADSVSNFLSNAYSGPATFRDKTFELFKQAGVNNKTCLEYLNRPPENDEEDYDQYDKAIYFIASHLNEKNLLNKDSICCIFDLLKDCSFAAASPYISPSICYLSESDLLNANNLQQYLLCISESDEGLIDMLHRRIQNNFNNSQLTQETLNLICESIMGYESGYETASGNETVYDTDTDTDTDTEYESETDIRSRRHGV